MVTLPESKTTLSLFSYYIMSICKYLNDSEIIWPESSSLCSCVFANSPHKAWHTKTTSSVQEHWYLRTEKLLEVLCSLLGEQQCWDVISLENCSKLLPPSRTSVTARTNACFPVLCRQWELPSTAVFCQLRAVTKLIWGLPHIKASLYLLTLWVSLKIGEVSSLPSCLLLGIIEASVFCTMIFSFFFFLMDDVLREHWILTACCSVAFFFFPPPFLWICKGDKYSCGYSLLTRLLALQKEGQQPCGSADIKESRALLSEHWECVFLLCSDSVRAKTGECVPVIAFISGR